MKNVILFITLLLSGVASPAQPIHFAHVTDTHVGSHTGASDFEKTVADINRQDSIDFVLLTGDITEFGSDEELLQARKIIDQLNKPWYIVPGNHDSKWSESGNNSFVTIFGSEKFSFEKGGYHFIGTSSGPNMRMAPGLVPREQLVYLDSVLVHRKKTDEPVIFINHYPLDESLSNWYKIIDLLKTVNIKATLLGHGHQNHLYNFEGIPGIMGRSNLQTQQVEAGYNLVSIERDTIFYRERLSSGKTLPGWCKVPVGIIPRDQPSIGKSGDAITPGLSPRPDFSVNQKYPNVKTIWQLQDKSDIGTAISLSKNRAIYANTAGEIVALDLKSGKKIWGYTTAGKIYSTPAVTRERVVCASTDHNIYCLNIKTGKLAWMHPTVKPIVASAAIEADRVYIGSSDGTFRCIHLSDGKLIWQYDTIKNFVECKPLVLKNSVCFGSWGNTYYSLDKESGILNWERKKYSNRMLSPAAVWSVASNGKIFIVAPDRHITALDELTGKEIWDSGKYSCRESIGMSKDGSQVYIKNVTEGNIDAFDTYSDRQKLLWECKTDLGYEIAPSPIAESGKYLFVPTASGVVIAISKETHQVAWKHKISNALINSVLPVGNHKLLVSVQDGEVVYLSFD